MYISRDMRMEPAPRGHRTQLAKLGGLFCNISNIGWWLPRVISKSMKERLEN